MEPAYLLLPLPTSRSDCHIGPCTSLLGLPDVNETSNRIVSGHLNGWIILWNLEKRRPIVQWIGHPEAHVTCLQFWPDNVLISKGRDGYIRFWTIPPADYGQGCFDQPLKQALSELPTCDVTFCNMSLWPALIPTDSSSSNSFYLAHVCRGDGEGGRASGESVEVVELPKNVIVTQLEASESTSIGTSSSGMCMALQGVPKPSNIKWKQSCLLLVANEAGQLLLIGDGIVLARLNECLGKGIPIMTMALQPVSVVQAEKDNFNLTLALGGPSADSAAASSEVDLCFVQLIFDELGHNDFVLRKISTQLSSAMTGVSSLSWRQDSRLVAVGQWDGRIRLVEHTEKRKHKIRCLGWLTSLGGLDEGELLGDWAATTVTKPYGPMIDQKSTTIRSCCFTPGSNWLLSAAPANAGAAGSILLWDVYRTST